MQQTRGFYISATKKSSGKTVISLGLGAAIRQSGLSVQAFKKGPDYIDPLWHQAATEHACFNLDYFTQTHKEIFNTFRTNAAHADVVYVEGNKGLFDGVDTYGRDCNAALAKDLGLPVVMIVNTRGMTRGIAPLLKGYEVFSDDIEYAGLIINEVAGPRHEAKLVGAVETYTDFKILGVIPRTSELYLEERHLGLIPENEAQGAASYISRAAALVEQHVDIKQLLGNSATFSFSTKSDTTVRRGDKVRIGIARDNAFGFYYPDDIQAMEKNGATIVYFDTLEDDQLPDVDALFIGGGFPEMQLGALQANQLMRRQIRQFVEHNNPVYAECGGLMYLCRDIRFKGEEAEMVGVIDAHVVVEDKPVGRGYVNVQANDTHLWGVKPSKLGRLNCHEFHYSRLKGADAGIETAYKIHRGFGIDGHVDGMVINNSLATYCHQRNTENNPWVQHFLDFVRAHKRNINENN